MHIHTHMHAYVCVCAYIYIHICYQNKRNGTSPSVTRKFGIKVTYIGVTPPTTDGTESFIANDVLLVK